MPWRVTVRQGPMVQRERLATLEEALDVLEERSSALAAGPALEAVDVHVRRYEAADRVAARAELRGPQRLRPAVHAGVDVRGDGSVVAWTGGMRREALAPGRGETPYDALRRALYSTSVEP